MKSALSIILRAWRAIRSDDRGQIAILFALSAVTLVGLAGGVLDFSNAYNSRQELSNAARLTCQYSTRPTVVAISNNGPSGPANYVTKVNSYATTVLATQKLGLTQTVASPFTYTNSTSSSVSLAASVPTVFLQMFGISTVPVGLTMNCATGQTSNTSSGSTLISESFENSTCAGTCYATFNQSGGGATNPNPNNNFTGQTAYVGQNGTRWSGMGYCLEVDAVGQILSSVPDGTHSAELDCDNGSHSAGNSSISTKVLMTAGSYELRYKYASRVVYPDYGPTYICGSTAADVAWASNANSYTNGSASNVVRSNQINVYLDQDQNGAPPTHTTIDGTQSLAGASLIDVCVTSLNWIQRSVKITVTTTGYYWLSFAADGANDSYGGQLDQITLCSGTCAGTVQDNFPSNWPSLALFEDGFETPAYSCSSSTGSCGYSANHTLNTSYGTNSSPAGWPNQTPSGWGTTAVNNVPYYLSQSDQGAQSIQLDNGANISVSRPFYLVPGYYQVSYDYVSGSLFTGYSTSTSACASPTSFSYLPLFQYTGNLPGQDRVSGTTGTTWVGNDTNFLAVFMSHSLMASYPNRGGVANSTTTYTNPDGTVTTTPTVAPDGWNPQAYNAAQANPLIDACGFANSWTPRTTYVKIVKPGTYWLTFAGKGSQDRLGATIDDVTLTALNSLYGAAPSFSVTVPTPSVAPGSSISYTGYSIVADPLTP